MPDTALRLFGEMFAAGIAFAIPVLALLFSGSILLGLLARAVPQLNVSEVGFTARVAAGLVALVLFAPAVAPALRQLHAGFERGMDDMVVALAD